MLNNIFDMFNYSYFPMVIQEAYDKISSLKRALPKAFIFVIDTTDRSFLYKSEEFSTCENSILALDATYGIEKLSRNEGFHLNDHDCSLVGFKSIEQNTYLGFYLPEKNRRESDRILAQDLIACM